MACQPGPDDPVPISRTLVGVLSRSGAHVEAWPRILAANPDLPLTMMARLLACSSREHPIDSAPDFTAGRVPERHTDPQFRGDRRLIYRGNVRSGPGGRVSRLGGPGRGPT